MTQKDYIRFAAMLKGKRSKANMETIHMIASATADIFEQDNSRFNRAKFLKDCGVESDGKPSPCKQGTYPPGKWTT
jgi:hypothetical protein